MYEKLYGKVGNKSQEASKLFFYIGFVTIFLFAALIVGVLSSQYGLFGIIGGLVVAMIMCAFFLMLLYMAVLTLHNTVFPDMEDKDKTGLSAVTEEKK